MCNRLNIRLLLVISCFQWFKDTKMRANHNRGRESHDIGDIQQEECQVTSQ